MKYYSIDLYILFDKIYYDTFRASHVVFTDQFVDALMKNCNLPLARN